MKRGIIFLSAGALGVGILALLAVLAHVGTERLPQHASGGDVLSVAFGDAKAVLSRAMIEKADSYFHGGVGRDPCVRDDHDHSSADDPHSSPFTPHFSFDPWRWVNAGVRVPQKHRHLQGAESVEMLPWLWASVKSDPHNEEAWEAAWYTAAHVMKDDPLAGRILDEGLARNPQSARLYLTKGQFLYKRGTGDLVGAERCFRQAVALAPADSQIREFATNYLADLAKRRRKD